MFARVYPQAASIELPVIVLGEYRFGIGQSRRRSEHEKWLREFIAATRVLVVEEETFEGLLAVRRPQLVATVNAELKAGHSHESKACL